MSFWEMLGDMVHGTVGGIRSCAGRLVELRDDRVSLVLMYLAIVKKFEPLLLLPIAFGMFIINIPGASEVVWGKTDENGNLTGDRGLLGYLYYGVEYVIYPPLIFLGIGAMTDFGPLIANPKSMLIGAAAQLGVFLTFFGAVVLGLTRQRRHLSVSSAVRTGLPRSI